MESWIVDGGGAWWWAGGKACGWERGRAHGLCRACARAARPSGARGASGAPWDAEMVMPRAFSSGACEGLGGGVHVCVLGAGHGVCVTSVRRACVN